MYRMKCNQTEIAFCLFVVMKTKQRGGRPSGDPSPNQ